MHAPNRFQKEFTFFTDSPLISYHSFPGKWKGTNFCLKGLRASGQGSTDSICHCQLLTSTLAIS